MRFLIALASVVLIALGVVMIDTYYTDPRMFEAVVAATGNIPLAFGLVWGPIPLGLFALVRVTRPRRYRWRSRRA